MVKRMKAEGVVDVLQTVRALRSQRPFMIQNQVRMSLERFVFGRSCSLIGPV